MKIPKHLDIQTDKPSQVRITGLVLINKKKYICHQVEFCHFRGSQADNKRK